ncbi:hypothetical protein ACH5RR_012740 [Cinchona calisaya]|uniref:Uncharacterized protein n=1 Tax=Cinchona calisaya TaxID=153742 RepID=A0ABD3A8P6_9GENT
MQEETLTRNPEIQDKTLTTNPEVWEEILTGNLEVREDLLTTIPEVLAMDCRLIPHQVVEVSSYFLDLDKSYEVAPLSVEECQNFNTCMEKKIKALARRCKED